MPSSLAARGPPREERELSPEAVARAAGMAPSTLSRLETGKRRLAVDRLAPLTRALGTSVDALLAPEPRVRRRAKTVNGMRVLPLSREGGSGPHAYHLTFPKRSTPDPRSHEGHEWLYVSVAASVSSSATTSSCSAQARPPSSTR
jgi:transcriptional regulator with XRE-family HTH domain